jgi:hypothetical protein
VMGRSRRGVNHHRRSHQSDGDDQTDGSPRSVGANSHAKSTCP